MGYAVAAMVCFLVGLRLSAFFSGSEIGFYRASALRLNIEAQSGDRVAQRLVWFLHRPAAFVATILVGNNVANYLTTVAVGMAVVLVPYQSDWLEVVATLLVSPIIFFFGELLPKNIYYQAPLRLLRRDSTLFVFFFYLFRIFTVPLVAITRILERFGETDTQAAPLALGRNRLVQVFVQGQQEGVLTATQHQFIDGLLASAARSIRDSMTPISRITGVDANADVNVVIQLAKKYGSAYVPVRRSGTEHDWYGYVATGEALATSKSLRAIVHEMSIVPPSCTWLEALLQMHDDGTHMALVRDGDTPLGIIYERGLSDKLIRPTPIKTNVTALPTR